MGSFDYLDRKMDKHDFLRSVLRAESETTITREPNVCLTCTFFLCSIELNTLLLVPNKPITDLRMNFLFFWSIFGHGRGPYGHFRIFPTWNFFLGLAGFITNLFQVRNLLNLIVQIYPHIKLD